MSSWKLRATGFMFVLVALATPTAAQGAETFEQAAARMKREHEQRTRENKAKVMSAPLKPPPPLPANKPQVSLSNPTTSAPRPPAPRPQITQSPEKALAAYIQAARSASSMSQLLPFERPSSRKALEERQKSFDPKSAMERKAKYAREGMDRETIEQLTASPYDSALKHAKAIANKITAIQSATVQGNEATVVVAIQINDVINGAKFTKSTATVGLVGEGNNWYFSTFRESNLASR